MVIIDENGHKRKGHKRAYNDNGEGMHSKTYTGKVYLGSYKDFYKEEEDEEK